MTDAPQPPPGWQPPNPPTSPPPPPPTSPGGYPPPPPASPPGWAAPTAPPPAYAPPPTYAPAPGYPQPPPGGLPPPPGAPGYGYGYTPYAPATPAKPLKGIATALSILLGLTGLAALGVAGALANRASVLDDPFEDFSAVEDADNLAAGTAGLYALLFIATIVLWLIWQFRHAKNAEVLGKRDGLTAGWAIGGWFIPLANFVLGPLQLAQSAKWSDPDTPGGEGRVPGLVVAWWVMYGGQAVIGALSGRFGFGGEDVSSVDDLEEFRSSDQLGSLGAFLTAVTAVVAILMVRQLTARQHQALANRGVPV